MSDHAVQAPLGVAKSLQSLAVILVAIIPYIAICVVGQIDGAWLGFVFLTYWGGVDHLKLDKLPENVLGAFVGLAVAYGLKYFPAMYGAMGFAAILTFILGMVYCSVAGLLRDFINIPGFIVLTVGTIPQLQQSASYPSLFAALAIAVVYFGGLAWLAQRMTARA